MIDAAVASKMPLVDRYDAIVFVEADLETRRQRARTRGWEPGELERREQRQDPPAQVRERADTVIPNQGNLEEAKSHVERFWAERVEPLR